MFLFNKNIMSLLTEDSTTIVDTQVLSTDTVVAEDINVDTLVTEELAVDVVAANSIVVNNNFYNAKNNISCSSGSPGNIFLGQNSDNVPQVTSGVHNICMGTDSGKSLSTGSNNIFLGQSAGYNVSLNSNNIGIGASALSASPINGQNNISIGAGSMSFDCTGLNIAVGTSALRSSGTGNIAFGYQVSGGSAAAVGDNNIIVGYQAAFNSIMFNNNILIGSSVGTQGLLQNAVSIGSFTTASKSNTIHIGTKIPGPQFNKTILGYCNGGNTPPPLIPGPYASDADAKAAVPPVLPGQLYIKRYNTGLFAPPNEQHVLCICLQ